MNTLQEFLIKSAGMEKQALNLAALLRMSRNAAKKGKLRRFSDLLDKRNLAIDNVAHVRSNAAKQQSVLANIEKDLIGYGPESKAYARLLDRSVDSNGYPAGVDRIIKDRVEVLNNETDHLDAARNLFNGVAGPWRLENLAAYSKKQNPANQLDKLTYPSL